MARPSQIYRFGLLFLALWKTAAAQPHVSFLQPLNLGLCQSLAEGDFNHDGNLDVACAAETVSIWLGDGHGHFHQTAQELPYPYAQVVVGDFNGDGQLDLVAATYAQYGSAAAQIVFLPGNGDGTFGAQSTISTLVAVSLQTIRSRTGGALDLVAVNSSYPEPPYEVSVFPGNGDGTFGGPVVTALSSTTNVVVADFNGDGIPDIATGSQPEFGTPSLDVVLGNGAGSFGPALTTVIAVGEPSDFVAADFDGDGIEDAVWSDGAKNIYFYKGNGDGTFTAGPVTSTRAGYVLLAADLNGDGRPDLVVAGMAIAMNTGAGNFGKSAWYQNPAGLGAVAGDFRNAGVQDLVVAGDYYQNSGNGTFHSPRAYPVACTVCSLVAVGDFNNDGNADGVVAGDSEIQVFAGTGGGQFSGFHETKIALPSKAQIDALAVADFNGDGNLDLAVGTFARPNVGQVLILSGKGNSTFEPPVVAYNGETVDALATADFNGSGNMGLAIGTQDAVIIMCGTGGGKFKTTATIKGLANSTNVVVADFNRDGIPDFATGSDVYLGNGDGTFRHSFSFAEGSGPLWIGDFNGDGIPDVLLQGSGYGYWAGLGDGTFGLPIPVPIVGEAPARVADMNGDGLSDIVAYPDSIETFYLSKGDGTFVPQTLNGLPPEGHFAIATGQFTNGSHPDLLMLTSGNLLQVLINSTK